MKITVLFESEKESYCFNPLMDRLKEEHMADLHIISVYEDLRKLENLLSKNDSDIIIAGSGLSASLPGVCASLTSAPVFGVPVETQLGGMDSLLSMLQMPFGNPVMTVRPSGHEQLLSFFSHLNKDFRECKGINLVVDNGVSEYEYVTHEIQKTRYLCDDKGLYLEHGDSFRDDLFNICLVTEDDVVYPNSFCLHVPVIDPTTRDKPTEAMVVYEWVDRGGLWLGIDNTRNAVLSFLRIRNKIKRDR